MHHVAPSRILAAAAVAALLAAGCGGGGGDEPAATTTTTEAADDTTTTTEAADDTTTTTEAPEDDEDDEDAALAELQEALDEFDEVWTEATNDRAAAVEESDIDAAQDAIAEQREAYADLDDALRDIDFDRRQQQAIDELLYVTGDVIANKDKYATRVSDASTYNQVLWQELASVNHWRTLMGDLVEEWDLDHEVPSLATLPEKYVGAGDRVTSFRSESTSAAFGPVYSVEVPLGFAGLDNSSTINLRGPARVWISSGLANAGSDQPPVTAADFEAFAERYAAAVADKAEADLDGLGPVDLAGLQAYLYDTVSDDFVSRDLLVLHEESGKVVSIGLTAESEEDFLRFEDVLTDLLGSFQFEN
jgi:hypothetical protein